MSKLKNFIWKDSARAVVILDQFAISGSNFLVMILLFRLLNLNDFGVYSIFFLLLNLVQTFHHSCVNQPLMSLLPMSKSATECRVVAGHFAMLHIATNIIFASIGATIFFYLTKNTADGTWFPAFVTYFLLQLHDFIRRLMFSSSLHFWAVAIDLQRYFLLVTSVIISVAFFSADVGLIQVIWLNAFSLLLPILVAVLVSARVITFHPAGFIAWLPNVLPLSGWLGLGGALQILYADIHYIVGAALLTPATIGMLQVSRTIPNMLAVLFKGIETFVPIRAANVLQLYGVQALVEYLKGSSKRAFIFTLSMSIFVIAFAQPLTEMLVSQKLPNITFIIMMLAASSLLEVLTGYLRIYNRVTLKVRIIFFANAAAFGLAILVVFPLISKFGIAGLLVGVLFSRLAALLTLVIPNVKHDRYNRK